MRGVVARKELFHDKWKARSTSQFVIDFCNEQQPNLVIDAGCGENQYKEFVDNLVGFDPVLHPNVDIYTTIEDANFEKESADIVMALGVVQFGNQKTIYSQVEKLLSWIKPNGYLILRVRVKDKIADVDIKNNFFKGHHHKDRYLWTMDDINFLQEKHNLVLNREIRKTQRWTWIWKKLS